MKKLVVLLSALAMLALTACTSAASPPSAPERTPNDVALRARISELETQLAEAEERADAPQTLLGDFAYYNMVYAEPEFTQAIINSSDGIVTSPVEYGFKCGHVMENEYAEVLAACLIKENAALKEPAETWLLIRCAVRDASEGDIGWVPLECAAPYTAENMSGVTWPLRAVSLDDAGFVAVEGSGGGEVEVSYPGGGTATIPAGDLQYPAPGEMGWFDK